MRCFSEGLVLPSSEKTMATSLIAPLAAAPVSVSSARGDSRSGSAAGFLKTSFLPTTKTFSFSNLRHVRRFTTPFACSFDHIPKRFREENLKDGCLLHVEANIASSNSSIGKRLGMPSISMIDMWIKAKELDANTDYYIELLAKGIGGPKEEIAKDIQRPKYFQTQEAIAYGIADKLIDLRDVAYEKRNFDEMLAQSKVMRRGAGVGPQAAPSGFR